MLEVADPCVLTYLGVQGGWEPHHHTGERQPRLALVVVVEPAKPLVLREWHSTLDGSSVVGDA